jgi:hypothetical protein
MPELKVLVTLTNDRLLTLADVLRPHVQHAADDTANAIRQAAADGAAKDTGSMAAGLYVATPGGSDYGERSAAAATANPKAGILPEVDKPAAGSATVAGSVDYSVFLELGTVHQAAQPFLAPAAEGERDRFTDRIAAAVNGT